MTGRQARYNNDVFRLTSSTAARMEKVQGNMAAFTTQQVPQRPSIRDYKNLKMGFKTRVKIWVKRLVGE